MVVAWILPSGQGRGAEEIVRLGAGSYAVSLPPGAREPQQTIYKTPGVQGKMPTNDWWSSLAWMQYSERQYPHPLAVQATSQGLRIYYPGDSITANRAAIFGAMPAEGGGDLILGHCAGVEFPDARVDGFSDWFVCAAFAAGEHGLRVSYGHGSPFVYATYRGGSARVRFAKTPVIWSGNQNTPVLGVTVDGKHYGLFGPTGSSWSGLGSETLTNHPGGKPYFSLALLPDDSSKMLTLFRTYAYAHVTDTRVTWRYEPESGILSTKYSFTTKPYEGATTGSLFAMYPHQWRYASLDGPTTTYDSVRGTMKLGAGSSFTTRMAFPGVLPSLPDAGDYDRAVLDGYLNEEAERATAGVRDTYWEGKRLGRLATLIPIAEQTGNRQAESRLRDELNRRLAFWLTAVSTTESTATSTAGNPKSKGLFYYNQNWGTLIGYPASYGSDTELSDHHFHYGYFIRAAAEKARHDAAWAADDRYGGMVRLLIRDIAESDRRGRMFPFLRCFDPYAGHSWASGHAKFGDGNNQESSSEAVAAWCGMILWGEATGDRATRDLGIYLYTTEIAAIDEYWFDVHGTNHHADFPASVATMIWGGKGANGTWFSANPEAVHGINWLPLHGGSLYLGRYPTYAKKNYDALVLENGGTNWDQWADLVWMYRALEDPRSAIEQFNARPRNFVPEQGNSLANAYHWIHNLHVLGRVERTITADYPLYAVLRNGDRTTHVVYNMSDRPRTVRFSDGTEVRAKKRGFCVE
ncbi:MAG: hypothetical protein A2V70_01125 [Planctomycetes bacterium RBG_13_63_9]|nr:MAG: hypothetical protein A2V70_01125 [Planctomycetes bacterium RBG_13_63_9]